MLAAAPASKGSAACLYFATLRMIICGQGHGVKGYQRYILLKRLTLTSVRNTACKGGCHVRHRDPDMDGTCKDERETCILIASS